MILNAETREQISAVGEGLEHPPRQDTLTFFEGSALNYGNYLDEVWTLDKRSGGVTVADLNDGTGGQRHFYCSNTLFSVYALTDETGAIAEAVQSYDAYGKISALITGAGTDGIWFTSDDVLATNPNVSAIGNPWFYTGQRVDPETGLQFSKNRYLSVDLGRWVSRDPIGYFGRAFGLYEYVHSAPSVYVDSSGTEIEWSEIDLSEKDAKLPEGFTPLEPKGFTTPAGTRALGYTEILKWSFELECEACACATDCFRIKISKSEVKGRIIYIDKSRTKKGGGVGTQGTAYEHEMERKRIWDDAYAVTVSSLTEAGRDCVTKDICECYKRAYMLWANVVQKEFGHNQNVKWYYKDQPTGWKPNERESADLKTAETTRKALEEQFQRLMKECGKMDNSSCQKGD